MAGEYRNVVYRGTTDGLTLIADDSAFWSHPNGPEPGDIWSLMDASINNEGTVAFGANVIVPGTSNESRMGVFTGEWVFAHNNCF